MNAFVPALSHCYSKLKSWVHSFICVHFLHPEIHKAPNKHLLNPSWKTTPVWIGFFCPKVNSVVRKLLPTSTRGGLWSWGCPCVSNNFTLLFNNSSIKRLLSKPAALLNMKFRWHLGTTFQDYVASNSVCSVVCSAWPPICIQTESS